MPLDLHADQQGAISRLLEDESLTEDLEDAPARVLLEWGIRQIKEGGGGADVRRLVRRLARVVRDRHELTPREALRRLRRPALPGMPAAIPIEDSPAPLEAEAALAALWAERETLSEVEWVGRLTGLVGQILASVADLTNSVEEETAPPGPPAADRPAGQAASEAGEAGQDDDLAEAWSTLPSPDQPMPC